MAHGIAPDCRCRDQYRRTSRVDPNVLCSEAAREFIAVGLGGEHAVDLTRASADQFDPNRPRCRFARRDRRHFLIDPYNVTVRVCGAHPLVAESTRNRIRITRAYEHRQFIDLRARGSNQVSVAQMIREERAENQPAGHSRHVTLGQRSRTQSSFERWARSSMWMLSRSEPARLIPLQSTTWRGLRSHSHGRPQR